MSPLPGASCWRVSRVARRRAAGDTIGANLTMGPVFSGVRRFYNPCRRVQPTPSAPLGVLGSAVVAGAAWRALGGNWSSVWRSNCPQTSANPILEMADSWQIRLPQ